MLAKDLRVPEWYIGTVDACWINRMLAGCQVQIKRGCGIDRETLYNNRWSVILYTLGYPLPLTPFLVGVHPIVISRGTVW